MTEAIESFTGSQIARQAFSPDVHEHLLAIGKQELAATRQHVTDWELRRGFENA